MLDQHHRRVRHVDPHLDHARRDENLDRVVTERAHHRIPLLGAQPPVHEPDAQLGEHLPQVFGHRRRRFQVSALRLVDHGIDDVRLTPRGALGTDELVDLLAGGVGAQRGFHGAPPGRPLPQLRHVEVAVQRQRERARDRGCREEQDVGGVPLLHEGGALLHPEAVLLVHHGEAKAVESHRLLDQGVRPHHQARRPAGDALPHRALLRRRQPADQELRPEVERLEQPRERRPVLLGEQLGGRHDRGLVVVLHREQHREQRHHRLAGADVAHQHPVHAQRRRHVVCDLPHRAPLVVRELEGEMLLEPGGELLLERERDPRAGALREMARAGLHELLVEELVEREAPPAGLGVVQVPRPVHGGERRAQLGNPHGRAQPRRMGIADQREQGVQMLVDEPADLAVRQALGRRIYRKDQAAVGPGLP